MACACKGGSSASKTAAARTYLHTAPSGKKTTYRTEVEAASAVSRLGGSYRAQ